MSHSYSQATIKDLFGAATTSAFPGCDESLVIEERGVRTIAVFVAHIRSPKADGPRYDPDFPRPSLNQAGNLLLLCGKHHLLVDQHESVFGTTELLQWKAAQESQPGGTVVTDAELAGLMRSLESLLESTLRAVEALTDSTVSAAAVGGLQIGGGVAWGPIEAIGSVSVPSETSAQSFLVGTRVTNHTPLGATVDSAGFDFTAADQDADSHATWTFDGRWCKHPYPHRLEGRSNTTWAVHVDSIKVTFKEYSWVPRWFRSFASLGDGTRVVGPWLAIWQLPIWEPGAEALFDAL